MCHLVSIEVTQLNPDTLAARGLEEQNLLFTIHVDS
jgi:hypothetical protein